MLPIFGAREIRNTPSLSRLRLNDYYILPYLIEQFSPCANRVYVICSVRFSEQSVIFFLYSVVRHVFGRDGMCLLRGTNWTL
jgi:hypothetical protein